MEPSGYSPAIVRERSATGISSYAEVAAPLYGPVDKHNLRSLRHITFLCWKWLLDKSVALLALIPALLIMIPVAIAIKLESRGPILFKQKRTGLNGEIFTIYKFRTMKESACKVRNAPHAVPGDQRQTRLGPLLRKTSIDELPQLLNVLLGNMSIIGPRPHMVYHDEMYRKEVQFYDDRFRVKPGITGWAQVSGHRGMITSAKEMQIRVDHDNSYIDNWSVWLDLYILFKTVVIVLRSTNAH